MIDETAEFPYGWNLPAPSAEVTSIVVPGVGEILPAINWDASTAEALRVRIYSELEGTTAACFKLEQSWTRLGILLAEFKAKEHWRQYEQYTTFEVFMDELKVRFHRGRTQLWGYLSVAEHLLPTISAERLETMGISKALELKRAMKKLNGKPMPQTIIDAAMKPDVTVKELRGDIGKALNLSEEPKGTWFDLDGFFMDGDERKEFKEAVQATEGLLGLKKDLPEHIRRKEVVLTWMREWYGTHAAEFNGEVVESTPAVLLGYFHPGAPGATQHVDCPCWKDGVFKRLEGCMLHPWDM